MLSNKLTFSLVFVLMFAFALAFVATPVVAQTVTTLVDVSVIADAKGQFVIIQADSPAVGITARDTQDPPTPGANIDSTANLPGDVGEFLRLGGTIEVLAKVTTFVTDADSKDQDKLDALKQKSVIISEIMWGLNNEAATSQWIELYISSTGSVGAATTATTDDDDDLAAGDIALLFTPKTKLRRLATKVDLKAAEVTGLAADTSYVVVDVVSTLPRFGAQWELKGQSGNIAAIAEANRPFVPVTPLISMYRKADLDGGKYKADLAGVGDGTEAGSWIASAAQGAYLVGEYIGSPGQVHVGVGGTAATFAKSPGSIAGTGVIINEVRNDTTEANLDWVELFNNTDPAATGVTPVNVENYTLSIVSGSDAEANLGTLPKYKLHPGEYLVVYNRDPGDTILAGGVNIEDVAAGTQVNKGASHKYVVRKDLNIGTGKILIVLRSGHEKVKTHEQIVDYVGVGFYPRVEANKFDTEVWPFIAWAKPGDVAAFGDHFNSGDGSWGRVTDLNATGSYWPKGRADNRGHKDDWATFGFVGTGYDRDVDPNAAPGTPGYANVYVNVVADDQDNAAKTTPYAFGGSVTISEIMYDAGPRWNLVQWIELYNSSMTETINLKGWTMEIRNKEDVESYVDSSFEFGNDEDDVMILPNQTLLLVSGTGANDVDNTRVYNLYQHHRQGLGLLARDSVLLSRTGFYLSLTAKTLIGGQDGTMVMDEAGNVEVDGATREIAWDLEPRDPAARQSLVRQYGTRAIDGSADAADDGTMEASWLQSDIAGAGLAYYGHRNDVGTPGFRLGGPLPVSLSSFRPLRDKATGDVVITWITQSELNNAGFNILRADSKDGEFKVINLQGIIAGHGTTSEKHVYTYTDKSAKPNVAYYYQIEDVSLNGNRTTLRMTHMRGNVNASGKLTTTWSNLKFQK